MTPDIHSVLPKPGEQLGKDFKTENTDLSRLWNCRLSKWLVAEINFNTERMLLNRNNHKKLFKNGEFL